jgi:hypothetical protein
MLKFYEPILVHMILFQYNPFIAFLCKFFAPFHFFVFQFFIAFAHFSVWYFNAAFSLPFHFCCLYFSAVSSLTYPNLLGTKAWLLYLSSYVPYIWHY